MQVPLTGTRALKALPHLSFQLYQTSNITLWHKSAPHDKAALHISNQATPVLQDKASPTHQGTFFTVPYHTVHHVHQKERTQSPGPIPPSALPFM